MTVRWLAEDLVMHIETLCMMEDTSLMDVVAYKTFTRLQEIFEEEAEDDIGCQAGE